MKLEISQLAPGDIFSARSHNLIVDPGGLSVLRDTVDERTSNVVGSQVEAEQRAAASGWRDGSRADNMDADEIETASLLALLQAGLKRLCWFDIAAEVSLRGTAVSLWEELVGGKDAVLFGDVEADDLLRFAMMDLRAWQGADFRLVTVLSDDYPTALRTIHQMPPVLLVRGRLVADERAVSVVGSRGASDRGLAIAGHVVRGLVARDISVLSGLAAGIDAAAHRATIEVAGRPVGVIGTGISGSYPASNRALQAEVAERGVVVSQFWPDAPPRPAHFPMRNATMSGLGIATVVVAAGEKSGARIQARVAVEHGRPVILTSLVVDANDRARALLSRPGVYRADRTSDVLDLVDDIARDAASSIDLTFGKLLAL